MTRLLLAVLLAVIVLAGCSPETPRRIDAWQTTIDQGWAQ